jgi:hypothetical protein
MICGRRRSDTVLIEVGWPPKSRVLPEPVRSSVRPLSRIEDAQLYPIQQVRNSEKDRPTPMKGSILK